MEAAEADTMKQPPRDKTEGIFAGGMGLDIVIHGFVIALLTVISYLVGDYMESGSWTIKTSADGMTMAFLTLSLVEVFHSFNMRSRTESIFKLKKQNKILWGTLALALTLTVVILYVPFLRDKFSFSPISLKEFGVAVGIAFLIIPIVEITKLIKRIRAKKQK
jgi:Ca2+-transporting ATPase